MMTREEINKICDQRLALWTIKMIQEHATPLLMIGIGHDQSSGKVSIYTVEDMADEHIIQALQFALGELIRRSELVRN